MALLRKLFYRKPPDGLLEISERVYVFDCCFTTDVWDEENYKGYVGGVISQLRDQFPDASILVFNFRDAEWQSRIANALSEYDMTIMDYPRQYEGCPLLPMEVIHHFLRSSESWLSLGQQNLLVMHCERGGWPVLAFMLAALLIYRKQYSGEQKTLDMVYKQAPRELLHLLAPLNPIPSQLRYLQYVSRRNLVSQWPPLDRALALDCVIIRMIPNFDGEGGFRPIFRIYGQDPSLVADRTPKILFSTPKRSKAVRHYKQAECELVKIDINCCIQGDVVLECISLYDDMQREKMIFRAMFNTAFIRSNILMLNRDEIDILWDAKDLFPKDFRAEVLFSEMDAATSVVPGNMSCFEEKDGLPVEAFAKVNEIFSSVDWLIPKAEAALSVIHQVAASNVVQEKLAADALHTMGSGTSPKEMAAEKLQEKENSAALEEIVKISTYLMSKEQSGSSTGSLLDVDVNKHTVGSQSVQSGIVTAKLPHPVAPSESCMITAEKSIPIFSATEPEPHTITPSTKPVPSPQPLKDAIIDSPSPPPLPPHPTTPPLMDKITRPPPPPPLPIVSSISAEVASSRAPPPPPPPPTTSLNENATSTEKATNSRASSPPPPPPSPPINATLIVHATSATKAAPLLPPLPQLSTASFPETLPRRTGPPSPPSAPDTAASLTESEVGRTGPPPPPPPPATPSSSRDGMPQVPSPPTPPPPPPAPPLKEISTPIGGPPPPPPPPAMPSSSRDGMPQVPSPPTPPPPPPVPPLKEISTPIGGPPPPPPPPLVSGPSAGHTNLSPLHWLKLTRAVQGSLWAESQKSGDTAKAPEIDISELESLFSAAVPSSDQGGRKANSRASLGQKPEKVQLIDHRRAYNCEIMLSKIKIPLPDLLSSVLALEDSALDDDQVENLIKFCPTKEEMELLKGYKGEKDKLGKCEQFFLELMQVPRIESKLRVFSFKIQFHSQVSELQKNLNILQSISYSYILNYIHQIRSSVKLKRIMQTILSLGNALNQGTARGSAVGFRLDSLLKLTDTRARNNKMTLMHYLCKVLADKLPELLDFSKDLSSLEPASKVQLKILAEEMQAISKGLEKVIQELSMSENDGAVSENFCKALKEFLSFAEGEVRSLASLYSGVGRNVDALILYFGEDPSRCPFEQVISTILNFMRMFNRAHEENCKQLEFERKKAEKEAAAEKLQLDGRGKGAEHMIHSPIKS
ncbi:unnamed protein product [Coffea canephora]|uniref:Formin-like protein n=1 Tax=Coffea canephora TaxID=49390 RepID=A0A068UPS2_COFCA|nr:unnamed protein product [Coffea canephora]